MARTTKEEAQKTRQKLIETAIDLFYEKGVSATTLEHIAEAADLTRGAIYWHFKNKPDLIAALHEHFHISILETINNELSNVANPPLERIRSSWRHFLLDLARKPMYLKVLSIFLFKCDYSGELADLLAQQKEKKSAARELITACFQAAIDRQDVNPTYSATLLTQAHMCYMHGIISEYISGNKVQQLEEDAESLLDFFFAQLPAGVKHQPTA